MKLPNGYGSISRLPGNRRKPFLVRVTCDDKETGLKLRKVLGYTATKKEALELLASYNTNPWELNNKKVTVQEVFELWLKYKAPQFCEKHVRNQINRFNKHCEPIKELVYSELRLNHFLDIINNSGLNNGGKNNLRNLFRSLDEVAYAYDIITKEYSKLIPSFSSQSSNSRRPFTELEIKKLWEHKNEKDVDLVLLLIYTGFRSGEFAEIKLENIDTYNWTIRGGKKTKAGTNRLVPIHKRIRPLLLNRIAEAKGNTLLNYSDKSLRLRFKKVMQNLGMNYVPHECRHTLRTRLDNVGANPTCINLILGHTSKDIGERVYTHKTLDQLHEAIALLD